MRGGVGVGSSCGSAASQRDGSELDLRGPGARCVHADRREGSSAWAGGVTPHGAAGGLGTVSWLTNTAEGPWLCFLRHISWVMGTPTRSPPMCPSGLFCTLTHFLGLEQPLWAAASQTTVSGRLLPWFPGLSASSPPCGRAQPALLSLETSPSALLLGPALPPPATSGLGGLLPSPTLILCSR